MAQADPWAEFRVGSPAAAPSDVPTVIVPNPTPAPPAATPGTGYRLNPDGTASYIPGGSADPNRPDAPRPEGSLTDLQRDAVIGRYRATSGFERTIGDLQRLYEENLAGSGRGDVLGFGGDRNVRANLPLAPTGYANFDATAGRLIDQIMATFDITGGEANSIAELRARFGPYIPASNDNDETIVSKLDALRSILAERRTAVAADLERHGIPIPDLGASAAPPPGAPAIPGGPVPAAPTSAPPGERITRGERYVTATGSEPNVALSHGDEQIDTGREIVNREAQRRLTEMLKRGAPDAEIREYARGFGINVDPALNFRRTPDWQRWRRENPNQLYPFRDEGQNIPMNGLSSTVAETAASPFGTAVITAGNAASAGTIPLVGDLMGQGEQVRLGLEASRNENPRAALAGEVLGGTLAYGGGGAVLGRLAPRAVASLGPWARGALADTFYGAARGLGENHDPVSGAAEGLIGGQLFRLGGRIISSTVSPTGGELRGLFDRGVYPSVGQRFRESGPVGAAVNFVEEASQSFPGVGQVVRANRQAARDEWERGAWNMALENLDNGSGGHVQLPPDKNLGPQAHQFAQQAFNDAYDSVRSRLSFSADPQWNNDLANVNLDAALLTPGVRRRYAQIRGDLEHRITSAGGTLNGAEFKAATSDLNAEIRRLRNNRNPTQSQRELLSTLEELDSAFHDGARRASPADVVDELDRVDRGYAMLARIEDASRRRPLQIGRFTPSDVLQVEARNGGARGRRFSAGEGFFTDYANQGRSLEDVLPSSGTSERTAVMEMLGRAAPYAGVGTAAVGAHAYGVPPEMIGGALTLPFLSNLPGARRLMAPRARGESFADWMRRMNYLAGGAGAAVANGETERN